MFVRVGRIEDAMEEIKMNSDAAKANKDGIDENKAAVDDVMMSVEMNADAVAATMMSLGM